MWEWRTAWNKTLYEVKNVMQVSYVEVKNTIKQIPWNDMWGEERHESKSCVEMKNTKNKMQWIKWRGWKNKTKKNKSSRTAMRHKCACGEFVCTCNVCVRVIACVCAHVLRLLSDREWLSFQVKWKSVTYGLTDLLTHVEMRWCI